MKKWIVSLTTASIVVQTLIGCSPIAAPTTAPSSTLAETASAEEPVLCITTPASEADRIIVDTEVDIKEEEAVSEAAISNETVSQAKEDLSVRLDIPVENIKVLEVRPVNWPDTSLGCAEPGSNYAQVSQERMLIRLSAGGEMYFYHSGAEQRPFLCEETTQIIPAVSPKTDEFVPPPGSEID